MRNYATADIADEVDAIVRSVMRSVAGRGDRLASLTLAGGPSRCGPDVTLRLQRHLSEVGIDFVDIRTVPSEGPLRLVATEFEPW